MRQSIAHGFPLGVQSTHPMSVSTEAFGSLPLSHLPAAVREAALSHIYSRTLAAVREAGEERYLARFFLRQAESARTGVKDFPAFLAARKWPTAFGFVPDLALVEWHMARAATLGERPVGEGFDRVTSASEPDWYGARFRFHPSVKLVESDWDLPEIVAEPAFPRARVPGTYVVFRRPQEQGSVRACDPNEAGLIRALELGVPLGVVLDRPGGPEFDAFLFHDWIQSGLLQAIHWARV